MTSGKTAQEPHLRFDRVDKRYENEPLIMDQLNLNVHRGEFLTLKIPIFLP